MSREAFPVLYFNLGGEMIYIVEQRLTAQSIDTSKADKGLYAFICTSGSNGINLFVKNL